MNLYKVKYVSVEVPRFSNGRGTGEQRDYVLAADFCDCVKVFESSFDEHYLKDGITISAIEKLNEFPVMTKEIKR